MKVYYEFCAKAFDLAIHQFESPLAETVSSGAYLKKYDDKYVFQFSDLVTGKEILAVPQSRLLEFKSKCLPRDAAELGLVLSFDDIDYGLRQSSEFLPASIDGLTIRPIDQEDESLKRFRSECTEDDLDTLDLTFNNELAFGIFSSGRLQGVARMAPTRSTPQLADITVLIAPSARGQRLATPLASHLLAQTLARGLTPKYRVAQNNLASQAIARRLGLQPLFRVRSWEKAPATFPGCDGLNYIVLSEN